MTFHNAQSKNTCRHSLSEGASAVPPFVEVEVCFGIENGEDVGKDPNTIDFRILLLSPGFQTPLPGSRDSLKLKLNVEPQLGRLVLLPVVLLLLLDIFLLLFLLTMVFLPTLIIDCKLISCRSESSNI